MRFAEIIYKNLRQRISRTILTVCGVAGAVAAMITLWNIAWGYAASANNFYKTRGVDIVVVRAGVSNRLTSSLRLDLAERIKNVPGVAKADGSLTEMVSLGEANLLGIPMRGIDPAGFIMEQLPIREGRSVQATDADGVLVGAALAAALNKRPGQQIEIEDTAFQIVGIFDSDNPFDANSIVARVVDVQKLMGRPGTVSEFQLRASASSQTSESRKAICNAIEALQDDRGQPLGLKAQPTQHFVDTASEAKLTTAMAWATTAIVLALLFVGILNTMLMSVIERTRELGLLRAIGWRRSRVIRMILGESVVISLIGTSIGLLVSWILVVLLSHWTRTSLLVPSSLSLAAILLAFGSVFVASVIGSFYPAFQAASVRPIESLRYE